MSASGSAFVNFDDILVDLKLTPSVLDIIAPRFLPALILQPFISLVSLTLAGTAWIHPPSLSAIRWGRPSAIPKATRRIEW
jgi:hypothetical protein